MSIAEFLPVLMASEVKLELINGYVTPFANGTAAHAATCERVVRALSRQLEPGREIFSSRVALQRPDAATYVFPDASYTIEALEPDAEMIFAPTLVAEVLSPLSIQRDRVDKLDMYQATPSVQEYLIVDSRRPWACLYRRSDRTWMQTKYGPEDTIDLVSIGPARIGVAELYAGFA